MEKANAIICDLDGTLCINDQGRDPFQYNQARHDAVNEAVAEALRVFSVNGEWSTCEIIFVSAREEYGREVVLDWLAHHLPWTKWNEVKLFMRPNHDFRKDRTVKQEIYERHIMEQYRVLFVLDDRSQVVEMWRELGLQCFQVAEGNF